MATQTQQDATARADGTNGRRGGGPRARARARRPRHRFGANGIARIADAVVDGAEAQMRALDEAVSGVNEMAASLKETASQAESVAASTEELVSSVNELSVSIEQVVGEHREPGHVGDGDGRVGAPRPAPRSSRCAARPRRWRPPSQQVAASITQMAAATKTMSRDTDELRELGHRDGGGDRRDVALDLRRSPTTPTIWRSRPRRPRRRSTRWRRRSRKSAR